MIDGFDEPFNLRLFDQMERVVFQSDKLDESKTRNYKTNENFMMIPLSIVIPVKNEAKNLSEALSLLTDFDDVQIVDSGSKDETARVAEQWKRSVIQFHWNGQFPKKRNWSLQNIKFKYPWVMFLDADERMTVSVKQELATFLVSKEVERYDVIRCYYDNWFMGRMLRHGDVMQKTAILRVGAAEYERIEEDHWTCLDMEIHEHIVPRRKGAEYVLLARMEHHDKRPLCNYYRKHEEYARWEVERYRLLIEKYGTITDVPNLTIRQRKKYENLGRWWFASAYFLMSYILKRGFLDGKSGYVFARGKMRYFRMIRRLLLAAEDVK